MSAEAEGRLLPVVPMTTRTFDRQASIVSLVEVYLGVVTKSPPVVIDVSIRDAREKTVFKQTDSIDAAEFNATHRVPYRFELPLAKLAAGEYLLTFDARAGAASAHRDVRFTVSEAK